MLSEKGYRYPRGRILVFARAPVTGTVKTRLAADTGVHRATELYAGWLRDAVQMCASSRLAPVSLCCTPDTRHEAFTSLHEEHAVELVAQQQGDLGARMLAALQGALLQGEFAVLIGSDCPVMDAGYLAQACRALHTGGELELVIGPAEDGGYVLLGARKADSHLFANISWGSDRVLQQTRARIDALGYNYTELPALWDVDRYEDLQRLAPLKLFAKGES